MELAHRLLLVRQTQDKVRRLEGGGCAGNLTQVQRSRLFAPLDTKLMNATDLHVSTERTDKFMTNMQN